MSQVAFWISLTVVVYTYAGYALLVHVLAQRRGRTPLAADMTPPLTVVITAHNEAARIAQRVRNVLDQDYPAQSIAVLVVDDGSDDGTARAAAVPDTRVRVIALAQHAGKAAALDAALAQVTTEFVVFGDARQQFARTALRRLLAPFADPSIGAVAGEVELTGAGQAGLYWRLERHLRAAEAELGWLHGVSGAIYALRTQLFRPLPRGTLLDDLWVPLHVVFAGRRVWMARDALAYDAPADMAGEYRRKLRTLAGNWQLLTLLPRLIVPWRNPVFFAWFSHKLLRLFAPWALLVLWCASLVAGGAVYHLVFAVQTLTYGAAALALVAPRLGARIPLGTAAASFVMLNIAALLSLPASLTRDSARLWRRS